MKEKLNWKWILFASLFTVCAIGINYGCSFLAGLIAFPLYLDSIMTIGVTAICGLVPGLFCAVFSNLLLFLFAHTGILFTSCHISTVIIAFLIFKYEERKNPKDTLYSTDSFMWIGFLCAISNSILGDTISNFYYGANTSIPQVDNAVQGIYVVTRSLPFAAYFGGTITNFVDKLLSATISLFVYRLVNGKIIRKLKHC